MINPSNNSIDMSELPTAIGMTLAFFVALANTNDIINAIFMGGVGYGGAQLARYIHSKIKPYLKNGYEKPIYNIYFNLVYWMQTRRQGAARL